ncbi:hypothetical protein [Brucella gallinifaecis]|uniref:hypothetical protein n=1 Tax=Brucella gallinifaecis TaxID=215590 RepID=UPI002361E619|nr:hypothetical protein [Brucella gallinifaecis]
MDNLKMKTKIGLAITAGILTATGLHLAVKQDVLDLGYSTGALMIMLNFSVFVGLSIFIGIHMLSNPKDIRHYIASLAALIATGYLAASAYFLLPGAYVNEVSEAIKQDTGLIFVTAMFSTYLIFCLYKIRKLAFLS